MIIFPGGFFFRPFLSSRYTYLFYKNAHTRCATKRDLGWRPTETIMGHRWNRLPVSPSRTRMECGQVSAENRYRQLMLNADTPKNIFIPSCYYTSPGMSTGFVLKWSWWLLGEHVSIIVMWWLRLGIIFSEFYPEILPSALAGCQHWHALLLHSCIVVIFVVVVVVVVIGVTHWTNCSSVVTTNIQQQKYLIFLKFIGW